MAFMKTATYFHCQLKPISRGSGKSIVNCAAYRTGLKLEDEHYGQTRDYTHKKDVVTSFTTAPGGSPEFARETETLWNQVEKKENRKNSILAYEWEIALPNELDDAHRENITRNIAGWLKDEYGVAVTAGIHTGGDRGNGKNDHAHVFMTTREISEDGWAKNKLRDFNVRPGQSNPNVDYVKAHVAEFINQSLADNGIDERVTHESYAARGIDIEGTKHLGPKTWALERDGPTERGDINRDILAAREAIEARLVWQQEEAQPEISAELEQQFVNRFGDDFAPPPKEAEPATGNTPPPKLDGAPKDELPSNQKEPPRGTPPDWVEAPRGTPEDWVEAPKGTPDDWEEASPSGPPKGKEAAQGTPEDWQPAKAGQGSDQRPEHTAWQNLAHQVRGYWQRLGQFMHDQTSGTPAPQQPEAQAPDARAAPDATSEGAQSWVSRVMENRAVQAGRKLLHGWGHRDSSELIAGIKETAAIVEDILAKGPQRSAPETSLDAEATPPNAPAPPAPDKAPSAFDRLSASVDATEPPQRGQTVSAFDVLMASRAAPRSAATQQPSTSPAPEPDGLTPEP
jgi:hypothetical protein